MRTYILRRVLFFIPTLLGITLVVFTLIQFLPGGPVENYLSEIRKVSQEHGGGSTDLLQEITETEIENIKKTFGYDKPPLSRYLHWLSGIVQGDFGISFAYQQPVWDVIIERVPLSLFLGFSAFLLSYLICIPLGIAKATRHGSVFDMVSNIFIFSLYVVPGYVIALILIIFLSGGSFLDLFPIGGAVSDGFEELSWIGQVGDFLYHMTLPLLATMAGDFAFLTLLVKNSLLDEVNKRYIITARMKGLSFKQAVRKHALVNALLPLATRMSEIFTLMFASSLLIEKIFNLDGTGLLVYNSMLARDYNVVMAIIFLASLLTLVGRLFADLLYLIIDPRVKYD